MDTGLISLLDLFVLVQQQGTLAAADRPEDRHFGPLRGVNMAAGQGLRVGLSQKGCPAYSGTGTLRRGPHPLLKRIVTRQ